MSLAKYSTFILLFVSPLFFGCEGSSEMGSSQPAALQESIHINQLGYHPGSTKKALVKSVNGYAADQFAVLDAAGDTVVESGVGAADYWEFSGDAVSLVDFSGLRDPGKYRLCVGERCSYWFEIAEDRYGELADAALKSYFYARAGVDIEEEFGGAWHYEGGHPDTVVFIHESAADERRPANSTISSPGGWYDAGDYGKYVVNSGITTWTLIQSLRFNRDFHEEQRLGIPESGNGLPDVLDEALVNLKWMLTMQDPNDGGVYHKLTTKNFDGFIMPAETSLPRYVVMKSTAAALDFAATMASAARVLREYGTSSGLDASSGLVELAAEMEVAATSAWAWALEHPDVIYEQPEDIFTGTYWDSALEDEWFWAAAELYLLSGDNAFKDRLAEWYQRPVTPKWNLVHTLGVISLISSEKREEFSEMEQDFLEYADLMLEKEAASPYHVSIDQFAWGSNSDVANDGVLKLVAWQLSGDSSYIASAQNDLDYILGRNATGYSFVTGFGSKSPMFPHNRIMGADGIEAPIPGFISGGPNVSVMTDCEAEEVVRSSFPAASFTDTECSYSTNETAINWNAPLVFLSSGLEVFYRSK